ncbi:THO complex subunit 5 [Coemansia aciculifera]|uniref:THO complex subunit 5 n=1 Tax=Coemansia aciculifera TaxID=417176 RepID=A0ACC1LZW0_9FUNG|nr:THO complex subunit 5 [Coemansia aciculifera]KAJ2897074.1 THO complex subunit 5 [Coemansia aciculifera]
MDSETFKVAASTNISAVVSRIEAHCSNIEQIAAAIVNGPDRQPLPAGLDSPQDILHTVTSTFVNLRVLNRQLHEDRAVLNASVGDLKLKTDALALELENKQREVMYIQKEIDTTQRQETIYQKIDLISEQEFLETAPDEYKQDIDTPHKLMLSRLRYEIKQRDLQNEANKVAKATRDKLRQAKRKRIEKLEKFDGQLQSHIKDMTLSGRLLGITSDNLKESGESAKNASEDAEEPKESKRIREIRDDGTSRVGSPRV